jgi:hypothetical protein
MAMARNTKAHITPKRNPPKPQAKVTTQTPFQPAIAIPLIDMVLPETRLKAAGTKPSTIPIRVDHLRINHEKLIHGLLSLMITSFDSFPVASNYQALSTRP